MTRGLRYWWKRFYLWCQSLSDEQLRRHRVRPRDAAWIGLGNHPWEMIERACRCYGSRTCLCEAGPGQEVDSLTFAELWQRVEQKARRLTVSPAEPVGLDGPSGLEWVVNDLALLRRGAISVPLAPGLTSEERAHILQETCLKAVLGQGNDPLGAAGEEPGPAGPPDPDAPFSVVYTSGSTGRPKGVVLTHRRWALTLRDGLQLPPVPRLTVNYLPLAHMAGRINLYMTLMAGGMTTFVHQEGGDLLEQLGRFAPTHMVFIPRLSNWLVERFQASYREAGGRENDLAAMLADPLAVALLRQRKRQWIGHRLAFVHIGSAPTAPEVRHFLEAGLGLFVAEVYGATELGPVTVDGKVHPWLRYKLVDRPELGCTRQDRPYPRGELAILSPRMTPGYFRNAAASANLRDSQGFMLTGDLVEERGHRQLRWLGRCGNTLRLPQGKFVHLEQLEELYGSEIPELDQLMLHGDSHHDSLLGLALARCSRGQLRSAFSRVASRRGLPAYEVPRDFVILSEGFSKDNGLLSAAGKLRRRHIVERYNPLLQALWAGIEERQRRPGSDRLSLVAEALGLPEEEIDEQLSFRSLGGDSLAAMRVCQLLEQRLGLRVAAEVVLDPQRSLASWEEQMRPAAPSARISLDQLQLPARPKVVNPGRPGGVLVTGAAGFLGRFLVLELLKQLPPEVEVWGLVRPQQRLPEVFRSAPGRELFQALGEGRFVHLEGDLSQPRLGLDAARWQYLAERLEAVVHAGAMVNHLLAFDDLEATNLGATREVLELAMAAGGKPVHYLSSLGLLAGRPGIVEEALSAEELWSWRERRSGQYAHGYLTGKWASEVLLHRAHRQWGLPLRLWRCCLLLPHSGWLGEFNPQDTLVRLLRTLRLTGLAPESLGPASGPYDALPVDLVAACLASQVLRAPVAEPVVHVTAQARGGPSLDQWVAAASRRWGLLRLPYEQFYARAGQALVQLPQHQSEQTLLPLWRFWERPRVGGTKVGYQRFDPLWNQPAIGEPAMEHVFSSLEAIP